MNNNSTANSNNPANFAKLQINSNQLPHQIFYPQQQAQPPQPYQTSNPASASTYHTQLNTTHKKKPQANSGNNFVSFGAQESQEFNQTVQQHQNQNSSSSQAPSSFFLSPQQLSLMNKSKLIQMVQQNQQLANQAPLSQLQHYQLTHQQEGNQIQQQAQRQHPQLQHHLLNQHQMPAGSNNAQAYLASNRAATNNRHRQNQSTSHSNTRRPAETGGCVTVLSGSSYNDTYEEQQATNVSHFQIQMQQNQNISGQYFMGGSGAGMGGSSSNATTRAKNSNSKTYQHSNYPQPPSTYLSQQPQRVSKLKPTTAAAAKMKKLLEVKSSEVAAANRRSHSGDGISKIMHSNNPTQIHSINQSLLKNGMLGKQELYEFGKQGRLNRTNEDDISVSCLGEDYDEIQIAQENQETHLSHHQSNFNNNCKQNPINIQNQIQELAAQKNGQGLQGGAGSLATYQSFYNNKMEEDFLTKTMGLIPSQQSKLNSNSKKQQDPTHIQINQNFPSSNLNSKRKAGGTAEKKGGISKINHSLGSVGGSLSHTRAQRSQPSSGVSQQNQIGTGVIKVNNLITTQGSNSNMNSNAVSSGAGLHPSFFKSFQNFPYPTASAATGNLAKQNLNLQNYNSNSQIQGYNSSGIGQQLSTSITNSGSKKAAAGYLQSQPTSTTNSSALINNKFLKSLKAFTQNYFGQQQEKKKQRLTNQASNQNPQAQQINNNLLSSFQQQQQQQILQSYLAGSNKKSNPQQNNQDSLKKSQREAQYVKPSEQVTARRDRSADAQLQSTNKQFLKNQIHENTHSQLKFGQIMEELERYSLTNNQENQFESNDLGMGFGGSKQNIMFKQFYGTTGNFRQTADNDKYGLNGGFDIDLLADEQDLDMTQMEHNFTEFNINAELGLDCEDIETVCEHLQADENRNDLGESSIVQSSIMESELEYANTGNIRASTYKRNATTEEQREQRRKQLKYYKSEDRSQLDKAKQMGINKFFTRDYLDNRYINDRVEMELNEFKIEIEEKFQSSELRGYAFIRKEDSPKKKGAKLSKENIDTQNQQNQVHLRSRSSQANQISGAGQVFNYTQKHQEEELCSGEGQVLEVNDEDESIIEQPMQKNEEQVKPKTSKTQMQGKIALSKVLKQNLKQQSFDNYKGSHLHYKTNQDYHNLNGTKSGDNVLFTTQDRRDKENGYNSLTQMTFDYNNLPSGQVSYLAGGINLTTENYNNDSQLLIHDQIQNQNQLIESQKQSFVQEKSQKTRSTHQPSHKTPKNYSLQLNQVVKKILSDNNTSGEMTSNSILNNNFLNSKTQVTQEGDLAFGLVTLGPIGEGLNNLTEMGTLNEPAFYTTYQTKKGSGVAKSSNLANQLQFLTKDSRMNNQTNQELEHSQVNRFARSNSGSRGGTHSKKKDHQKKRSDSNLPNNKNTLINKFFRQSKQLQSPQSRQQRIKPEILKAHNQLLQDNQRSTKQPITQKPSVANSNLSSNRFLSLMNPNTSKPVSQTRRQTSTNIKTVSKSTKKNSRLPSSNKKSSLINACNSTFVNSHATVGSMNVSKFHSSNRESHHPVSSGSTTAHIPFVQNSQSIGRQHNVNNQHLLVPDYHSNTNTTTATMRQTFANHTLGDMNMTQSSAHQNQLLRSQNAAQAASTSLYLKSNQIKRNTGLSQGTQGQGDQSKENLKRTAGLKTTKKGGSNAVSNNSLVQNALVGEAAKAMQNYKHETKTLMQRSFHQQPLNTSSNLMPDPMADEPEVKVKVKIVKDSLNSSPQALRTNMTAKIQKNKQKISTSNDRIINLSQVNSGTAALSSNNSSKASIINQLYVKLPKNGGSGAASKFTSAERVHTEGSGLTGIVSGPGSFMNGLGQGLGSLSFHVPPSNQSKVVKSYAQNQVLLRNAGAPATQSTLL